MDQQEIKSLLSYLEKNRNYLNPLQNEYVASLKRNYEMTDVITQRQVENLQDIEEYIPSMIIDEPFLQSQTEKYHAQYSSYDSLSNFNF